MMNDTKLIVKASKKALSNFEYFARRCFYIVTKDGVTAPLVLNRAQSKLVECIEQQQRSGKPVRIIILKARQLGISTVIEAYILWRLLREGYLSALELAHEKGDAARHILDITRYAVEHLPQWFRAVLGVQEKYFTKTEITFEHNYSSLSISSADSKEAGRSQTIHLLHLSEVAFYPDTDRLLKSLFAAVPKSNKTAVFLESTGNGPAGYFYDTYTRAKQGKNEYIPLFFPWYWDDNYRMEVPEGVEVECPESLRELYEKGEIDDEQLYWRQWVIENDYNGDEDAFAQEYPATEEEAFIREASVVFNPHMIYQKKRKIEDIKPAKGFLRQENDLAPVVFVPQKTDKLLVFERPVPGRFYVIGADVGSGVVINREGDYSSADVLDVVTGMQAAHLHYLVEPASFADDLYLLGMWYNNALIAIEVTGGHGLSAATALRDKGYTMIYQRKVYDKVKKQDVNKIGFDTTKRTKKMIIDNLRADLRNNDIKVMHKNTLDEMLTFIKTASDKLEAVAGAKDDRVISMAIAAQVRREAAVYMPRAGGQVQQLAQGDGDRQAVTPLIKRRKSVREERLVEGLGAYS